MNHQRKKKIVLLTETDAFIYKGIQDIEPLKKLGTVVVDPDLLKVRGVAPHFWKLDEHGGIVAMNQEEQEARLKLRDGKPLSSPSVIIKEVPVEIIKKVEVPVTKIVEVKKEVLVRVPIIERVDITHLKLAIALLSGSILGLIIGLSLSH